jgi:ubiquinone/menaquinone biosynthesis C-methylase UbiE
MSIWKTFFIEKTIDIFNSPNYILDIGGGLRVLKEKNNRFDKENYEIFKDYLQKVRYKIMDPVPDYGPDIVGDIHNIPLKENEVDAIICLAVLEHVENPIQAVEECYRVMKKGGKGIFYLPFIYYYHAETGYYKDYWRFTADACDVLFKKFSVYEKCAVRGRFETSGRMSGVNFIEKLGAIADRAFKKNTKQVSGYYVYVEK